VVEPASEQRRESPSPESVGAPESPSSSPNTDVHLCTRAHTLSHARAPAGLLPPIAFVSLAKAQAGHFRLPVAIRSGALREGHRGLLDMQVF